MGALRVSRRQPRNSGAVSASSRINATSNLRATATGTTASVYRRSARDVAAHLCLQQTFQQNVFEVSTAVEDAVDLDSFAHEPVEDPPRRFLNLAPGSVADRA